MIKAINTRRPFFYRDKRILISFLVSMPTAYFFGIFPGIFMHLATGVAVDCWFFQFKKVKESDITPQGWLDKVGISKEGLDNCSLVFIRLRYGAFFAPCIYTIATCYLDSPNNYDGRFHAIYLGFRLLGAFYIASKKIMYPWVGAKFNIEAIENHNMYRINTFHSSLTTQPNFFSDSRSMNAFTHHDMMSPTNPIGFLNPSSPNYTFSN